MESYAGSLGAGQQIGRDTSNLAQSRINAAPVPEASVAQNLAQGCEALSQEMISLEHRVAQMLTRLAGPIPASAGGEKAEVSPSGLIGTIEARLMSAANSIRRTHELMSRLERII